MIKGFLATILACALACSSLSAFELKTSVNNNQNIEMTIPFEDEDVKLIEDIKAKNGEGKLSYSIEGSDGTTFTIEYGHYEKTLPKVYFQRLWNIKSLLFPDVEYKNALQLMKDFRLSFMKTNAYGFWKLLTAKDENDIIFEKKVLDLGPYRKSHELIRILKTDSKFYILTYKNSCDHFTKVEMQEFNTSLKEMRLS